MKILHITNDFSGSKVYRNLIGCIDKMDINQLVYHPVLANKKVNAVELEKPLDKTKIHIRFILSLSTRINFFKKRKLLFKDIVETIPNIEDVKIVHAHTWFSDGAVAYDLFRSQGIPYIVTIRNSDLNLFYKYMLHLRPLGQNILKNAKNIILISAQYKNRVLDLPFIKNDKLLIEKLRVIPNGIDDFWLKNVESRSRYIPNEFKLVYIGNFTKNKNVVSIVKSFQQLKEKNYNCELHIVGGGGDKGKTEVTYENVPGIVFHGKIFDKVKLKKILNDCHIFIMPSHTETFGLVYVEALSQGLPLIYTKDEGIDNFYKEKVGEAVNSKKIKSIVDGLVKIVANYDNYNFNPSDIVVQHNWNVIARTYIRIYETNLSKK